MKTRHYGTLDNQTAEEIAKAIDRQIRIHKIGKIIGIVIGVAIFVAPVAYVVIKTKQAIDEC